MKIKTFFAATAIAAASVGSSVASTATATGGGPLGVLTAGASFSSAGNGDFLDDWSFTLSSPSIVGATLMNLSFTFFGPVNNITDFAASLDDTSLIWSTKTAGSWTAQVLAGGTSLNTGLHHLWVSGTAATGASYSGSIVAAPVPEPEAYGMLLAGLGMMGAIARRRSKTRGS